MNTTNIHGTALDNRNQVHHEPTHPASSSPSSSSSDSTPLQTPTPTPTPTPSFRSKKKRARLSRLSKSSKITIIGTGPSGLSAALSLQQAGFCDITLFEKDDHFYARKDGYGLTLTYNPSMSLSAPLQTLGLLETIARMDCPSRSHYVFHKHGKILGYYGNAFMNISKNSNDNVCGKDYGFGQRGNLRVPRQSLRKVMIDALIDRDKDDKGNRKGYIKIQWGKKLVMYSQLQPSSANDYNDGYGSKEEKDSIISLTFQDGSTDTADLLIGADGIRSKVVEHLLSPTKSTKAEIVEPTKDSSNETDLSYIGIMIVLGITSDFCHPLLDERGFYTLDGEHRLFTMPFEGCRISDIEASKSNTESCDESPKKTTRRYMWQLSYTLSSLEEATNLSRSGSKSLLQEVLKRTNGWHQPVQEMLLSTPLETIWGTPLMDRQPSAVYDKMKEIYNTNNNKMLRTVVLGDSVHAMSPFKGQGCNQALMDGPLLSSWLIKSATDSAIKGFMREMAQRTNKKVTASRDAAVFLHSKNVLFNQESFAGVKRDSVALLLSILEERNIGANQAHLGQNLDEKVAQVIKELDLHPDNLTSSDGAEVKGIEAQTLALTFARNGDTAGIRHLSLSNPGAIRIAKDKTTQETCLHLAAKRGCYHTCRWLISEANVNLDCVDKDGNSVLDSAKIGGNASIIHLLSKIC